MKRYDRRLIRAWRAADSTAGAGVATGGAAAFCLRPQRSLGGRSFALRRPILCPPRLRWRGNTDSIPDGWIRETPIGSKSTEPDRCTAVGTPKSLASFRGTALASSSLAMISGFACVGGGCSALG